MDKIIIILIFVFCLNTAYSQIKEVGLQLQYDNELKVFNCVLIINDGVADTKKLRAQFNSQISVYTPSNTEFKLIECFEPTFDKPGENGKSPLKWAVANMLKDIPSLNSGNLFGITPNISPTAFYNKLEEKDAIKLFSFTVDPIPKCAEEVALLDQEIIDKIQLTDLKGGDFTNSFSIGGLQKINIKLLKTKNPMLPSGKYQRNYNVFTNESLILKAGDWSNANAYQWVNPNGDVFSGKEVKINNVYAIHSGIYKLIVSNEDGCSVEKDITVQVSDLNQETKLKAEKDAEIVVREKNEQFSSSIFPNPAKNHVNVVIKNSKNKSYKVEFYDLLGNLVFEKQGTDLIDHDDYLAQIKFNLSNGFYLMALYVNGEQKAEHKLLVTE